MKFYTVKEVAEILSVNEETVRRWIREGKLIAQRGSGRQGSKISEDSLKLLLDDNKGLITGAAVSTLGVGVAGSLVGTVAGSTLGVIGGIITPAISSILLGTGLLNKYKSNNTNGKILKLEFMEREFELEKRKAELLVQISRLQNEVKLIESQIGKIDLLIEEIDKEM